MREFLKMKKSKTPKKTAAETTSPNIFSRTANALQNQTVRFVTGAFLVLAGLFCIIAFGSFLVSGGADQSLMNELAPDAAEASNYAGYFGAVLTETFVNHWFGLPSLLFFVFLVALGCNMMGVTGFRTGRLFAYTVFLTIWMSVCFSIVLAPLFRSSFINPGGNHGVNAAQWLNAHIGMPGTVLVLLFTMLLFCIWVNRNTVGWLRNRMISLKPAAKEDAMSDTNGNTDAAVTEPIHISNDNVCPSYGEDISGIHDFNSSESPTIPEDDPDIENTESGVTGPETGSSEEEKVSAYEIQEKDAFTDPDGIDLEIIEIPKEEEYSGKLPEPYNPRLELLNYKFPTADLLKQYDIDSNADNKDEQQANKNRIINVLRSFGIEITSISATPGPTVTLYEITPAEGIRISKIRNLEDDIALSLSAYGIRIIAPIPGKGTIGIEVPNANPIMVPMQSVIKSRKFVECNYELPVAIGKTITNELYMFDLAKMPHLLVAGATGMGKSVGLNAIVTSLLYKKHPSEMKLVMVDPKMVEFSIYASIDKHFLAKLPDSEEAIITDPTKVVHTLKSLCIEMDSRYELLKDANVRSVTEYNKLFISRSLNPQKGHRYLPYIVVVIDEFGDLIMTAGKEIETPICRIAQKARAVGMHMIIATQRPTTNIITGTIKANFPARMAFRVTSMTDSRTILDRSGANQLIGRGDMLFSQGGDPQRIQCAFIDTPEVQNICSFISGQQGYTTPYELPEYVDENDGGGDSGDSISRGELDSMFEDAARLIVSTQQGSTSMIQRKFKIGYNRAGRIMDQLEKAGIVSAQEGSKPRQVLCIDDIELEQKLQSLL